MTITSRQTATGHRPGHLDDATLEGMIAAGDVVGVVRHELDCHGFPDWRADLDRAVKRYGCCHHKTKTVTVSARLVAMNPPAETLNMIRHEVAHVVAGAAAGHGPQWRAACEITGARPERCHTADVPEGRYLIMCPTCGKIGSRNRRPSDACLCRDCGATVYWIDSTTGRRIAEPEKAARWALVCPDCGIVATRTRHPANGTYYLCRTHGKRLIVTAD